MTRFKRILDFFSWWLWRRWRIYCPPDDFSDYALRFRAEFNRGGWPCSDRALFFPPMAMEDDEDLEVEYDEG